MRSNWKKISGIFISLLLILSMTFVVYGAKDDEEEREKLTGVNIKVESSVEANTDLGTVTAVATNPHYSISSCEFVTSKQSWKPGEVPKVKIIVEADDGYYFKTGIGGGSVKLKGATFSGLKRLNSGETLEITVKLKAVKGVAGEIDSAYWSGSSTGRAGWDKADSASSYELKLYRDDKMVKHVSSVNTNSYNFFPYMTKVGDYTFTVRAIPKSGTQENYLEEGEWTESDSLYIDSKDAQKASNQKVNDNSSPGSSSGSGPSGNPSKGDSPYQQHGWLRNDKGWWYEETNGTYPRNEWKYIDNKWYLFDLEGYMRTDWQNWNNNYYYLGSNGDMATGWLEHNRNWYYLGDDGAMKTGWIQLNGDWYFLNTDGSLATGWLRWGSVWYYLNPSDGKMARNTVVESYQIGDDGVCIR